MQDDPLGAAKLLDTLLRCRHLSIIIAIRHYTSSTPSGRWYTATVGGLKPPDDYAYLKELCDEYLDTLSGMYLKKEIQAFNELLILLSGHPLCLKLAGHQIKHSESVTNILSEYKNRGVMLLSLVPTQLRDRQTGQSLMDSPSYGDPMTNVVNCLDISYETLSLAAQALFQMLARLPMGFQRENVPRFSRSGRLHVRQCGHRVESQRSGKT